MPANIISIKSIVIFFLLVAGLTAGVLLLREQVRTRPKATVATQTTIYLDPASAVMPPNQTLKVMLDVGAFQVGFVRVEADFDPTKIQLTDEISISPTHPLQTVMSKTTKTAANNSGHVDIMVGLPPENMSNPATGVFELAQIPVSTVSTITNDAASFTISTSGPQVADLDQVELTFTAIPADFTLNATGDTPTPTPTTASCQDNGQSCNMDGDCCSGICVSSTRTCSGSLPTDPPTATPIPTSTPVPGSTTQAWFADDANVGKRIDVYFPSATADCVPNSERGNIDVINADSGSAIGKMVDYSVSAANTLDSYWCGHWDNSTAANQLPDTLSNFETGEDFSSWSDGTATWDGGTRITDNPKKGSYALKASFTGGTGQALLFNNLGSKAATTQTARFSGYYRTSSTALPTTFQARVVNKNVNNWLTFGAADLAACASGQWCYFEAVVDGHSDSTGTEIDITAVGSGNIDLYLDQLSLQYEDSAPTNILEGAIFRFASKDGSTGEAKDFRIDFGLPQFVSFELVGRGGRSNNVDLGSIDITATATPVSAVAPNCSNLSGPDAIIVGQTGTFTADYYSPGVALGGEIFWSTNGQTDINRINYQDLTPPTANMSVDWAPTEIGDYVIGCRAWNDAIAECRPAEYVPADHPEITACTGPTVTKSVRVANPSTITPTPTPTAVLHPISWQTDTVALSAEDFYVVAGGETFYPTDVTVHSDPGNSTYTSLEATWYQAGVEMRLFMYFNADDNNWWSYEIRTYNGQTPGDWIYYTSGDPYFTTPIGITHLIKDTLTLTGDNTNPTAGSIYFKNLSLQAFTNLTVGPSLTFKTRLQGITTKKADEFLKVTLKQNGQVVKTYENVRAIADDEGVYTATISGFTPGTYDVLVKSISHLQRKFTGVSLIDGATAADFTKKVKINQ